MSATNHASRLISFLPKGRIRNYLTALHLNGRRGNPFKIRFDVLRKVWRISYKTCEFIFSSNPYQRFKKDLGILRKMPAWSPEVIIDANPGQGTTSVLLASQHPDATVYVFEPDSGDYNIMMENMYHNNLSNTVVVPRQESQLGRFLLEEIAGHFFDKSIVLKIHLPDCSQEMISIIADIWRYNRLRVILTTESNDLLSYSYDGIGKSCSEQGLPYIFNRHDRYMPVSISERNLLG